MTSGISYKGTDLDTLYQPIGGTTAGSTVGFQVAGTDISQRYAALSNATAANTFIGQRIPATGILTKATSTDLSSLFVGNAGAYSVTAVQTATHALATSPFTYTVTASATFASAAALTNYFTYGGRALFTPSNVGGSTIADVDLGGMFSQMQTIVVADQGAYVTGSGSHTTVSPGVGALNITATSSSSPQTILTANEPTLYTNNSFTLTAYANAAPGSATKLTFTMTLAVVTHGSPDTYTGTYNLAIQQRNYAASAGFPGSTQANPTWNVTGP